MAATAWITGFNTTSAMLVISAGGQTISAFSWAAVNPAEPRAARYLSNGKVVRAYPPADGDCSQVDPVAIEAFRATATHNGAPDPCANTPAPATATASTTSSEPAPTTTATE